MNEDLLDYTERTALEAVLTITTPIPKDWAVVDFATMPGFDSEVIAYGLIYVGEDAGPPQEIDFDWAVVMKWDGWVVTLDLENAEARSPNDAEPDAPPCATAPPDVLIHVLSVGSRIILAKAREEAGLLADYPPTSPTSRHQRS